MSSIYKFRENSTKAEVKVLRLSKENLRTAENFLGVKLLELRKPADKKPSLKIQTPAGPRVVNVGDNIVRHRDIDEPVGFQFIFSVVKYDEFDKRFTRI